MLLLCLSHKGSYAFIHDPGAHKKSKRVSSLGFARVPAVIGCMHSREPSSQYVVWTQMDSINI